MRNVPGNMGPEVERFLTEFCFGDIYTRNGLDLKTRELLAYCILTTLEPKANYTRISKGTYWPAIARRP